MTALVASAGSIVSGFQAWVFLWLWCGFVLVYAVWRSLGDAPQDEIRPPGPLD